MAGRIVDPGSKSALKLFLCLVAVLSSLANHTSLASIEPAFYVGGHDHPEARADDEFDGALKRLAGAKSDEERRVALAAVQKLGDGDESHKTYRLGLLYLKGSRDLVPDFAKAEENFEKSAAKRNALAYYQLALMSLKGKGRPADVATGLAWLDSCGQLNLALCLYEEAALYYTGSYGVPEDIEKAMALGTRAAALGERSASWGVAKMYLLGEGAHIDVEKGLSMLRSLSDQGYARASGSLGELYADPKIRNEFFDGDFDGRNVVPPDFRSAVPADYAKAISYWELGARQGNCHSFLDLGSFYDRGLGVTVNYGKGAEYLAQGVSCDPTNSYYLWKLGKRIEDAKGVPRDCVEMSKLYYSSMVFGYVDAAADLGYLYDKGCGSIQRDDKRALRIYLACAKADISLCQNNVGAMLKHGRGIGTPDLVAGFAWLTLAAENGNDLAQKNLENYHDMFSEDVRRQALDHLDIVRGMVSGVFDMRPILEGELEY